LPRPAGLARCTLSRQFRRHLVFPLRTLHRTPPQYKTRAILAPVAQELLGSASFALVRHSEIRPCGHRCFRRYGRAFQLGRRRTCALRVRATNSRFIRESCRRDQKPSCSIRQRPSEMVSADRGRRVFGGSRVLSCVYFTAIRRSTALPAKIETLWNASFAIA
jgi:hypothetical protein